MREVEVTDQPERDAVEAARDRLAALRGLAQLGDVVSALDVAWDAQAPNAGAPDGT